MGLGNDFASDAARDAAIAGFAQMGLVKGTAASLATTAVAGVATVAFLAVPLVAAAGILYLFGAFDDKPKASE